MQASEVAELLSLASAYDNRKVTKEAAVAWKVAIDAQLPDMTADIARQVIVEHFTTSGEYFTVKHLIDGGKRAMRRMPKQIADDVRSAKARGLIGKGHDPRVPLPADAMRRLMAARAEARESAPEITWEESRLQIEVGKRV